MPRVMPIYESDNPGLSDEPEVRVEYENKGEKIVITYIFPGYSVSNVKRKIKNKWKPFREVGMSGTGFYSVGGDPVLPSLGRFVQIPNNYHLVKVRSRRFNPTKEKKCTITWAEEIVWDEDAVMFVKKVCEVNKYFPEKNVEHSGSYYMDGYKVLLVHVRPLQYNPGERSLRICGKIKVYIELSKIDDWKMEEEVKLHARCLTDPLSNLEGFDNLILNPGRKVFEEIENKRNSREGISEERRKTELLIVYGRGLKRPAERLKTWKEKRGIRTKIISIKMVGNRPGKIKQYIKNEKLTCSPRLRYVLLFGGVDKIAVSQEEGRHAEITDHYFYTHKDAGNKECLLPWVSGGRIPVGKEEDGMSVVDQIIRYEKEPPFDSGYYKRMIVAGYFGASKDVEGGYQDGRVNENSLKTMEDIRKHMISRGFEVKRVYFSKTKKGKQFIYRDGTPVPREVKDHIITDQNYATKLLIEYINEGQLIVCHRGHGWWDGWLEPRFKTDDLKSISSDIPCVLFSINCLTGSFHEPSKDVFTQKMLVLDGGAPTLIAANFITYTWHNDSMAKALFDAVWPGIIPVFPKTNISYPVKNRRLGDLLNYAKAYLLINHGANAETKEQFELYHVLGDPTLEIWEDEPSSVRLRAGIMRDTLYIKMNICPRDAVLTIWHCDKLLKRIRPLHLQETVPLKDLGRDPPYSICLSAPGYRFTEALIK